jgi:predicted TIM-barrel fold metal-dependent hydrolase
MTASLADRRGQLDAVLELAAFANLALKWSHAPSLLSDEPYPHRDVLPLLRRAIEAFGVQRLIWASDYTQARVETGQPWAQALYYLLDADALSDDEKEWLLGRSARQLLRWPAPT